MKWIGNRKSDNVEDRRGMGGGTKVALGGGLALVLLLIKSFFPESAPLLDTLEQQLPQTQTETGSTQRNLTPEEQAIGDFAKTVLAYTEDTWTTFFAENGLTYREPKLVLFSDAVQSGCGAATAATGPFYCPADHKIYFDLTFMQELEKRFGARGGDFAMAYIIAHEVGHHIQTLLGTSADVRRKQANMSEVEANKLSVALELQADFYAGIWAHYNQKYLEAGDLEEALSAAQVVGDDAIQKRVQGHVNPDSFTHGTSEQRLYWFQKGFQSGDMQKGDTFAALLNN